jgi:hypothetical protein
MLGWGHGSKRVLLLWGGRTLKRDDVGWGHGSMRDLLLWGGRTLKRDDVGWGHRSTRDLLCEGHGLIFDRILWSEELVDWGLHSLQRVVALRAAPELAREVELQ